jgi:hypothetical protein
MGKQRVD